MTSTIDPSTIGKPTKTAKTSRRHVRSLTGYTPETDATGKEKWPVGDEKAWKEGIPSLTTDTPAITKSVVNHVHTSLARQAYNLDNLGAYQASALSVRDNLIVRTRVSLPFAGSTDDVARGINSNVAYRKQSPAKLKAVKDDVFKKLSFLIQFEGAWPVTSYLKMQLKCHLSRAVRVDARVGRQVWYTLTCAFHPLLD
ncbi:hypothetical protein C8Q76DRAFT_802266 [Earliella scabrosa]|nr:hypothetical protein C8Q76DRAFT_802266 [Earliella scabrosa]